MTTASGAGNSGPLRTTADIQAANRARDVEPAGPTPLRQGTLDAASGKSLSTNPHKANTSDWLQYRKGWFGEKY